MRPLLLPHLRRLWRDGHTVQLGVDPRTAAVLELPTPTVARVLDLVDGTRTEHAVITAAADRGVSASDAAALLDALREESGARARGAALRARAAAHFSWDRAAARLDAVYRRLVSR